MESEGTPSKGARATGFALLVLALLAISSPLATAQDDEPAEVDVGLIFITLFVIFIIIFISFALYKSIVIIQPYEQGLKIRLGRYTGPLNPGLNWIAPFITRVVRLDLRVQVFDVPQQEVITKDNSPTRVDAVIYIKVVDPEKAYFQVSNFKLATVALAQTTLRSTIGDMELDEILYNRHIINTQLRDTLDEATDPWGVKVEMVEIREVDPVDQVKAAMEEQTASEREKRAAILRAEGSKRSAILEAEGAKRSRILQAEGIKQSKIIEAEGERLRRILETQGEAQALRILSMGAAAMDQKALTVKSLDTLATMADGKSTKIVFPFELSRLMEGASEFVGASRKVPDRPEADLRTLEEMMGPADKVLGEIPSPERIAEELRYIEEETEKEAQKILEMGPTSMLDLPEDEGPRRGMRSKD